MSCHAASGGVAHVVAIATHARRVVVFGDWLSPMHVRPLKLGVRLGLRTPHVATDMMGHSTRRAPAVFGAGALGRLCTAHCRLNRRAGRGTHMDSTEPTWVDGRPRQRTVPAAAGSSLNTTIRRLATATWARNAGLNIYEEEKEH